MCPHTTPSTPRTPAACATTSSKCEMKATAFLTFALACFDSDQYGIPNRRRTALTCPLSAISAW